jgi:glycosyltransferase involved in cell wall biosynthesis
MSTPSSNSATRPRRVAIIDRCVPHYRKGLYDALMADREMEFTIVAAAQPVERIGTVAFPGPRGSNAWRWIDAPGVNIPGSRGASVWQWAAVKAGFSRRFDAIIMMANPNDPSLWLSALAARLTGKRLVFWTHGLTKRDHRLRRFIRVAWFRLAHTFAIYGHLGKAGCLQEGFAAERCHVCYNSLDYEHQRGLRQTLTQEQIVRTRHELFGQTSAPITISISRLAAFKKIDLLIRAHAQLVQQGHDLRLLIVGDGSDRARLESLTDQLNVRESVRFFGECYDEDRLASLIAACDLCVTPGAIGLTVMHCLAYGVPCITHDDWFDHGPEFEAIVKSKTGDFFRKDDVDDLARVMQAWLLPAPRKPQMAAACIAHLERFYMPRIQAAVMKRALRGEDADDLWVAWGKWREE